jgi:hypothetical protein
MTVLKKREMCNKTVIELEGKMKGARGLDDSEKEKDKKSNCSSRV